MPHGSIRGGFHNLLYRSDSTNLTNENYEEDPPSAPIFCAYCPPERPAMTQKSVFQATYCTKCNSAYHRGCIKRCRVNEDGSVVKC